MQRHMRHTVVQCKASTVELNVDGNVWERRIHVLDGPASYCCQIDHSSQCTALTCLPAERSGLRGLAFGTLAGDLSQNCCGDETPVQNNPKVCLSRHEATW